MSASERYTRLAKLLHWAMAALIFGLIALGLYMEGLPFSPDKLKFYAWHKWGGVAAFGLVVVRLVWRACHRPPPLPAAVPRSLRLAAHAGHATLYLLMIAIPISGWLMSSAKGVPTVWFGVVPLPDVVGKSEALGELLQAVHKSLNWLLIAVLAGHVGAALKHHFIDRDHVLARMLPGPVTKRLS